ncbi:hypothetical protein DVV91_14780 [Clostridium botulinum]|uniref:phage replisome organizer N-terminal domain-containing protein n=1 Tax=Clostridium botulinum TaxID=1491 RepID=UPI001967EFCF|nr:phage replisome organizer N-terminal domain-containing protein [Clostridium botulinum]MBN1075609.1 hypothetical protein [Clostridium botulinum]
MERKIVKLRVDMYNDTKFKIIDTMEERDLIHYIWTRLLTLAGKVNLEGKLYLSRSIPYTIETLALEFNRSAKKVELALKVFMDLEMTELDENNVYKVRNFAKHQNIKPKKKDINKDELETVDNEKVFVDKSDNHEFIIRNQDSNNKLDSIERTGSKENETDKFYVSKSNNDFIINKENKFNKSDMSKRKVEKNKALNKDITGIINVEKIKKDSNFNTNNKIRNGTNFIIKENKSGTADLKVNTAMNNITEDNHFVFNKSNHNKKTSKSKNKNKYDDEIICNWNQDGDNIEICDFTDEIQKGNIIATFKV